MVLVSMLVIKKLKKLNELTQPRTMRSSKPTVNPFKSTKHVKRNKNGEKQTSKKRPTKPFLIKTTLSTISLRDPAACARFSRRASRLKARLPWGSFGRKIRSEARKSKRSKEFLWQTLLVAKFKVTDFVLNMNQTDYLRTLWGLKSR